MQIVAISKPVPTAEDHFRRAFGFYARNGQGDSAIAQLTAGMLAMAEQMTRLEHSLIAHRE